MYSLKQIAEITETPLRTVQNWFKDVEPKETDNKTRARFFDDETIVETLKKQNIDFITLFARWHANGTQDRAKDEGENTINKTFSEDGAQPDAPKSEQRANDAPTDAQAIYSIFEKQIAFYQAQLEEKDKQISNLSASLSKSNELLQNEQQLNLLNLKQIDTLKAQLLLETQKETTETPTEEAETIEKDDEKPKKSFFHRLFGL